MISGESTDQTTKVIVQHTGSPGLLAAIFGCIFGILGILASGIIFFPLALICTIIGFIRSASAGGGAGLATSFLAAFLCLIAFLVSPSLWALFAVGVLSHEVASNTASPTETTAQVKQRSIQQAETTLNGILSHMGRIDAAVQPYVSKLNLVESQYHAITDKMDEYLERERSLIGDDNAFDNAAVTRNQLSVSISQASNVTEQLHNEIQSAQWDFENNAMPLIKQVADAKTFCQRVHLPADHNSVPADYKTINSQCQLLFANDVRFDQNIKRLATALSNIESVYQSEKSKQDRLENISEQIE